MAILQCVNVNGNTNLTRQYLSTPSKKAFWVGRPNSPACLIEFHVSDGLFSLGTGMNSSFYMIGPD